MSRVSRAIRLVLLATALAAVAGAGQALASAGATFHGIFRESFGGVAPSGVGYVVGFGSATESFVPLGDSEEGTCVRAPGITTVTLGGGTIRLREDNLLCRPGASGAAPGGAVSYGNPVTYRGTYTILGGTGVFDGASGEGSILGLIAGDVLIVTYDGSIQVP